LDASPLLCAGITTFNALRGIDAPPGALVAIQGIGGLGHLGVQYANKLGYRVVATARGEDKRALAEQLGAHHYIDSAATDPGATLTELGGAAAIIATAANGIGAMIEKLPFEDAPKAYERMMSGKARFRVVLEMATT
jgi:propanol-preferring alcohol dehydrogenase